MDAARTCDVKALRHAVEAGACVTYRNRNGETAATLLALRNCAEGVAFLAQCDASLLTMENHHGWNPIMWLIANHNLDAVLELANDHPHILTHKNSIGVDVFYLLTFFYRDEVSMAKLVKALRKHNLPLPDNYQSRLRAACIVPSRVERLALRP